MRLTFRDPQGWIDSALYSALLLMIPVLCGCDQFRLAGFGSRSKVGKVELATVVRGPFDRVILEQGELESSNNVNIECRVKSASLLGTGGGAGRGGSGGGSGGGGGGSFGGGSSGTAILWVVPEGTYVRPGDRLVELDGSQIETSLKAQRIRVSNAESNVIKSEASVKTSEIALRQYLEGTYISERKMLLSQIALAQQAVRSAELQLKNGKRLAEKGAVTALQIEADEFGVENAKQSLQLAESNLRVLDELIREKNKVQLQSDIDAAKALLEAERLTLSEEQDKFKELQEQLTNCVIDSPAEGVVVYNNQGGRMGSEFVVEEGALIRERQTIIKLPDLTKMRVKALINESNINTVASGMQALVSIEGIPGDQVAVVKQVNRYAEPGNWFASAVKEYATLIELVNPPEAARTGMTAEVRIFAGQIDDALQLPVDCIYDYKGHLFCVRKAGDSWETVEIELGGTNAENVAVTTGLDEGDQVVLAPRKHMDLMELPDLDDVENRESLLEIGNAIPSE
jgi:HlyD family secretion protein